MKRKAYGAVRRCLSSLLAVLMCLSLLPAEAFAAEGEFRIGIRRSNAAGDGGAGPAESITVTVRYEYSPTSGLAGIQAHAPDVIELVPGPDGTADLENWKIPRCGGNDRNCHNHDNLAGFQAVLDPEPLNGFLVETPDPDMTRDELMAALAEGRFNLRDDVDTDGAEYNAAWDAARTATVDGVSFTYVAPAGSGGTDKTASDDAGKQYALNAAGLTEDVELTVYFRRGVGTYEVRHWMPAENVSDPQQGTDADWRQVGDPVRCTGRNGAMTNAQPLDTEADDSPLKGYQMAPFSQRPIEADGSTAVDIYYLPEDIRVIFDSDDFYIPRQLVRPGGEVDLGPDTVDPEGRLDAAKPGYVFSNWQYKDTGGNLRDVLADESGKFALTSEFLGGARLEGSAEAEGVHVLRLYPKWAPAATSIRVTLWTEDLNGHDVSVVDTFYDFGNGREDERSRGLDISYEGSSYTNAGSFTITDVPTGSPLVEESDGTLIDPIQREVDKRLYMLGTETVSGSKGTETVDVSGFYTQLPVPVILAEEVEPAKGTVSEVESTVAAANGSTQVYVYFRRNEYKLAFHYYFLPGQVGQSASAANACIFENTDSFHEGEYDWPDDGNLSGVNLRHLDNILLGTTLEQSAFAGKTNGELFESTIPYTTTITAKYGADLSDVWPGAENISEEEDSTRYVLRAKAGFYRRRISWTPTAGLHRSCKVGNNFNIPGAYSTLSAAIMADPEDPGKTNHLVAYWFGLNNNTYRFNYCYEVPGLTADEAKAEGIAVEIYHDGGRPNDVRNTVYLLPRSHEAFARYGFTDLLTADEIHFNETAAGSGSWPAGRESEFYVVRIYGGSAYAVSRQLVSISSLRIGEQNPSAYPNLTLVNAGSLTDHSTEIGSGGCAEYGYVSLDNPYDVYFYYDRDRFTVTYMSSGNSGNRELGQIELPYGTMLSGDKYGFRLDYRETNGTYAKSGANPDGWLLTFRGETSPVPGNLPVCPDRSPSGTAAWEFLGWGLSPSSENLMQWDSVLSGNLRLYACWEWPAYDIHFDLGGGELLDGDSVPMDQKIPANRAFSSSGQIPRPVRAGCVLSGWAVTGRADAGIDTPDPVDPPRQFHFEEPVSENLWVQAQWTSTGAAEISYTVRYLAEGTEDEVRDSVTYTGVYLPGTVIWESPQPPTAEAYRDYAPLEQAKSVTLEAGKANEIVFYYAPPPKYGYAVEYVDKNDPDNKVVYRAEGETVQASVRVTPGEDDVSALSGLGYYLVGDDGRWAEDSSVLYRVLEPANGNAVATFYVMPETYRLPRTGGTGTAGFYLSGSVLAAAAVLPLIRRKRSGRGEA